MKNSADQGGCYPHRPKAKVDNTLRDVQNSSYPTKANYKFSNCFMIHSKYFPILKGVLPCVALCFSSVFFCSPKITQSHPQVFLVNSSIICSGLHFWRHWFNNFQGTAFLISLIQYGDLVNRAGYGELCLWFHSETGKYFDWIIIKVLMLCIDQIVMKTWDSMHI